MADVVVVVKPGRARWYLAKFVLTFTSLILCWLLYAPQFSLPTTSSSYATTARSEGGYAEEDDGGGAVGLDLDNQVGSPCSSLPDHTICCDRSDKNADVCFMAGDVRTDAATLSLLLFPPPQRQQHRGSGSRPTATTVEEERIRPYTRKWEDSVFKTVHEVTLRVARPEEAAAGGRHRCDVRHDAPVHVVTAGGYNFNYFHAFNDGFLPSWLTVQHLRRRVVLAVLAYSEDWAGRYGEVIDGLSNRRVVDLINDNRTHCFPGAIIGTRFHGYLTVDPAKLRDNKTIVDFHRFLAGVYKPTSQTQSGRMADDRRETAALRRRRPRLGIVSRRGTRMIENEAAVARLAAHVGFDVDILEASKSKTPPLAALHATVSELDALVGAHGSDLTSFLFLRPGRAALVQVAPLGITALCRRLFGEPAALMGLRYEQYEVRGHESSLSRKYPPDHVVVADPERANRKKDGDGDWDWDFIGRVYLGDQNVTLDLARFRKTLVSMHSWLLQQQRENGSS